MKTICFISNLYPSESDPTFGSFVKLNYEQLSKMGHSLETKIVIDRRLNSLKKLTVYFRFFYQGLKALINGKYDLYYFHYLTYSTLCLLPILPFKKLKYVVNIHGDDLVGARLIHKVMGFPSPYILKHATSVIVPSDYFKHILLDSHNNIPPEKVIISPSSGFQPDIFFPKKSKKNTASQLLFGYVSRIDEGKGWDIMLKAISKLKSEKPELYKRFKLSVYGKGKQVKEFEQMIEDLKINDVVTYYGAAEHKHLGIIYRSLDYFIFPTARESLGLVAIEALACGTPVICSNIKPLTEFVIDGKNGYLFDKNSSDQLYKNVTHCFSIKPQEYINLVQHSARSVTEFKANNVMNRLRQDLEQII